MSSISDALTPTCFSTAEESAYYYEALAELAEQEALEELQELQEQSLSITREVEALPIPAWLLDEGHDLELDDLEPLEASELVKSEALEVAA